MRAAGCGCAGSTVLGDIVVADGATVGGHAVVTREVPIGATVVGVNKIVSLPPEDEEYDRYTWFYDI